MSRIGNAPVEIISGVTVDITGDNVKVSGSKGTLEITVPEYISVKIEDNQVIVARANDDKPIKAKHGLVRSLINNMVIGVNEGYKKVLEVNGVGFKINLSGRNLKLALGYSHDVNYTAPEDIDLSVDGNKITVSGIDKQLVGQVAADIRELRKPEPYKGKGIKYEDEHIIRKAGKSQTAG